MNNPRIPRSKESSRSTRLVESMRIIAKGVTHRDGGSGGGGGLSGAIGAISVIVAGLVNKIRNLTPTVVTLNLDTETSDPVVIAPPGPRGKQGLPGKQGPPGLDFMNDGLDIPMQIPGQRGLTGPAGATGATGASGRGGGTPMSLLSNEDDSVIPVIALPCAPRTERSYDTNGFRLTLSSGNPVYAPAALTPTSTNTTAETVTFSADHLWTNGTIVTPNATASGLTINVYYFIHVVSSTSVSFHTNVADALSGSSPVNLTGNVTTVLRPIGVSNTTIYLSPHISDQIALFDAGGWKHYSSGGTDVSAALGTLTNDLPYDVFVYLNAGALALELVAWSSKTARTTALVRQNGVLVKSGATNKRFVGAFCTDSTTTTIQSLLKQFLYNENNRVPLPLSKHVFTAAWTYSSNTTRQANGDAANQLEIFVGREGVLGELGGRFNSKAGSASGFTSDGIGEDSTTTFTKSTDGGTGRALKFGQVANSEMEYYFHMKHHIPLGKHVYSYNEAGDNSTTFTKSGDDGQSFRYYGLFGTVIM